MADVLDRRARAASTVWNVTRTLLQVSLFWFVMLIALPIGISVVEVQLGIQRFPGFPVLSAIVLAVSSLLALWSVLLWAITDRNTMVTSGPYAYVRDPFTIAFMGQATAIVLALGSFPVMIYFIGLLAWMYFRVRPRAERRLRERFGERWMDYERQVRAYRPRLKPYLSDRSPT